MPNEVQNYRALVAGNNAAARAIKALISDALERDATSINVNHVGTGERVEARLRVLGEMTKHGEWPAKAGEDIIAGFRRVGIGPRKPGEVQDGQCDISVPTRGGERIRKRLDMNLMPLVHGSMLTIKVVPLA